MKIYKFKDLTAEHKHCHFLQIVLENSIWCARPDSLNDEDEFKFRLDYEPSRFTAALLFQVFIQCRTTNYSSPDTFNLLDLTKEKVKSLAAPVIDDLVNKSRDTIGIISFSITKSDVHLWDAYGGNGNGVCVEINIPDHLVGQSYHQVHYVSDKIFHVDSFLESLLFPDKRFETFRNILLTKTKKWEQEEELRFISKQQNISLILDGQISEVTFGANVPTYTLEKIVGQIADYCRANNIRITKLSSQGANQSIQSDAVEPLSSNVSESKITTRQARKSIIV